jgi:hypothetical protein
MVSRIRMIWLLGALFAVPCLMAAPAVADELGPTPQICDAYAPAPLCFYAAVAGTDTFNLSTHILHVGQELSGVYRWEIGGQGNGEFPAEGAVTVEDSGPGLKLLHCDGPHSASNAAAKYGTDKAFDVTKGSTTCTWRAVAATNAWENGPNLLVDAGGESYPAGDFYAVIGKGGVIEGHVLEQNVKKAISDLAGLAGAKVRVTGPGGYVKTTTTSDTGFYQEIVKRPGSYTVTAEAPKSYFKGEKRSEPDPTDQKVDVGEDSSSRADFTFKSTLKLKLALSTHSVPANGLSYVNVTVSATDGGAPDAGLVFSLRPYGGGSAIQSPFSMSVPATICTLSGTSVGGRVWPDPSLKVANTDSVSVTTDAAGEATLRVYTGTVPGKFPLTVWALDDAGKLITKDVNNVSADADVDVTPLGNGGDPAYAIHNWLNKPGNEALAGSLPTDYGSIVTSLAQAIQTGSLAPFILTPVVSSKGYSAVLLSPEGSRAVFNPETRELAASTAGAVVAPGALSGASLYAGGYWGYLKTTGTPAAFPTLTQWLANSAPGYAFPSNGGTISIGVNALQYLGFGYGPSCT